MCGKIFYNLKSKLGAVSFIPLQRPLDPFRFPAGEKRMVNTLLIFSSDFSSENISGSSILFYPVGLSFNFPGMLSLPVL